MTSPPLEGNNLNNLLDRSGSSEEGPELIRKRDKSYTYIENIVILNSLIESGAHTNAGYKDSATLNKFKKLLQDKGILRKDETVKEHITDMLSAVSSAVNQASLKKIEYPAKLKNLDDENSKTLRNEEKSRFYDALLEIMKPSNEFQDKAAKKAHLKIFQSPKWWDIEVIRKAHFVVKSRIVPKKTIEEISAENEVKKGKYRDEQEAKRKKLDEMRAKDEKNEADKALRLSIISDNSSKNAENLSQIVATTKELTKAITTLVRNETNPPPQPTNTNVPEIVEMQRKINSMESNIQDILALLREKK